MALTVISNFAANVAHRNLSVSDGDATQSLARLSSGKRVQTAKDDAAALAIGSRLRAEVAAIQAARVNAGQAASMLQIADGAMSQIDDILVRLKTLSIQAGSSQFGSVERGLIDAEYQQLLLEIDRIAKDTEFNGANILDGGELNELVLASDPGLDGIPTIQLDSSVDPEAVFQYSYNAAGEILSVTKLGVNGVTTNTPGDFVTDDLTDNNLAIAYDPSVASDATFSYSYAAATEQLTVTNITTGEASTIDISAAFDNAFGAAATAVPSGESLDVTFGTLGVTVTLTQNFDTTTNLALPTDIVDSASSQYTLGASSVTYPAGLSAAAVTALNGVLTGGQLTLAMTAAGGATVAANAAANLAFGVDGGTPGNLNVASANLVAANSLQIYIDVDGDTVPETQIASIDTSNVAHVANGTTETLAIDFNQRNFNTQTTTATSDQTVQIDLTESLDTAAGTGQNLAFDETLDVDIEQFGVTLTLDKGFDRAVSVTTTTGTVGTTLPTGVTNASFAPNAGFLTADVYDALLNLGFDSTTGIGYDSTTGVLSLQATETGNAVTLDGLAGLSYGFGDGNNSNNQVGTGSTTDLTIALPDGSTVLLGTLTGTYANGAPDGALGTIDIQLGRGVFSNQVDPNAIVTEFTFRIGTGDQPQDSVVLQIDAVNVTAIGLAGSTVSTEEQANTASQAISDAVATLNRARANVGALQNRLDIAAANLAVSEENTEAARSQLIDLDVAQEITNLTSKQILVQAGVSVLSQANQLPQNLLRLFQ